MKNQTIKVKRCFSGFQRGLFTKSLLWRGLGRSPIRRLAVACSRQALFCGFRLLIIRPYTVYRVFLKLQQDRTAYKLRFLFAVLLKHDKVFAQHPAFGLYHIHRIIAAYCIASARLFTPGAWAWRGAAKRVSDFSPRAGRLRSGTRHVEFAPPRDFTAAFRVPRG